jgi:oligopeptidase B
MTETSRRKPRGAPVSRPPVAPVRPVEIEMHGVRVRDDYAWIKAPNWQEVLKKPRKLPAEIRDHLKAENACFEAVMGASRSLRRKLVAEMRARIKEDDSTVPALDGPFAYFTRYRDGAEHPQVCRRRGLDGADEVLLDANALAQGHDYFDLGDAAHSPDHRLMAWSADENGSEYYRIRVRDIASGADGVDELTETDGDVVWCRDNRSFYYVKLDANHRPWQVMRHKLGTKQAQDEIVFEDPDPGHFLDVDETQSGDFALIASTDHETAEIRLLDLRDPQAKPVLVAAREPELRYDVEHHGDSLIIRTNADGAEDGKIVTVPLATPQRANWRDLVPARPGIMVVSHVVFAHHLVRLERENALPRIVVRELATGEEHAIAFAEEAYSLWLDPGYEFDTDVLRFGYSSMTTPSETYDYDMVRRERTLRKRQELPSGHDPARYVTRRIMARSHDGEMVPVSLLHRADLVADGSAPCLLYGYGSYGTSISAGFRTNPLSLVDRGFVYAIAHVRGGTEKGWAWYKAGKREHKTNTFRDFIAAAEGLIAAGFTARGRIVAHGASAGGMLMGAVANDAPDLFAGIVAEVPFVDVLATMLDADLPLTPPEWPEWGNPISDPAAFATIRAYSPYDNVRAQVYPPILAIGGLTDPRVTYWEPAKWVARLRATMTGGGPILLRTNMAAGHGGASGRFERLSEVALVFAFAIRAVDGFPTAAEKTNAIGA